MFNVVLMMALATGGEVSDFGGRKGSCGGCSGCYGGGGLFHGRRNSCYGCSGCYGGSYGGGYGGGYGGCYGAPQPMPYYQPQPMPNYQPQPMPQPQAQQPMPQPAPSQFVMSSPAPTSAPQMIYGAAPPAYPQHGVVVGGCQGGVVHHGEHGGVVHHGCHGGIVHHGEHGGVVHHGCHGGIVHHGCHGGVHHGCCGGVIILGPSKDDGKDGKDKADQVVKMLDGKFAPVDVKIKVGQSIQWKNEGDEVHTATSDEGTGKDLAFDTGDVRSGGASKPITFKKPGTVRYHCHHHPKMKGTITIEKGKDKEIEDEAELEVTEAPAKVIVTLPAEAKLKIEGQATKATGAERTFVTPKLAPGAKYSWTFEVELPQGDKPVTWTQTVSLKPGETHRVSLTMPVHLAKK